MPCLRRIKGWLLETSILPRTMAEGAQTLFHDCCRCLRLEKVVGLPFSWVQRHGLCSPDLL